MILVIGDVILDSYEELETVSQCPEGEWPIVNEVKKYSKSGGAAAVYHMVREHTESVRLEYGNGGEITKKTRVTLDGKTLYRVDKDRQTGLAFIPENVTPDVVLIADYGKGAVDKSVIEECLSRGWKVIVDPHPSQDPAIYHGVYAICPNRMENQLHGYAMRSKEWPRFCLKLDKDGMLAFDHGEQKHFASTAVQPIMDVCGAGDQVLAMIGVELSKGSTWLNACETANHAAGIKCGKHGATPVTSDELASNVTGKLLQSL